MKKKKNFSNNLMIIVVLTIFICIMAGSIFRTSVDLTFMSFLEYFSNCPSIETRFIIQDLTIKGSWGLFDGFRSFLNIIASAFGFLLFVVTNLVNCALFLAYCVAFIFGV